MNKLDQYYIDTQNSISGNYKKVEDILNNFKTELPNFQKSINHTIQYLARLAAQS